MTGGLIQIASYGIHDIFLIGNPQITFFRIVYRKHTNFAMEYIEEAFDGVQNFGGYLSCNLSKAGDLLHKLYLQISIPQVVLNKLTYSNPDPNVNSNFPYTTFNTYYNTIQSYINTVNYNIVQPLKNLLSLNNLKYNEINSKYSIAIKRMNYNNVLATLNNIIISFNKTFNIPLNNGKYNIIYLNQSIAITDVLDFNKYYNLYIKSTSSNIVNDLTNFLNSYTLQLNIIKKNLYDMLLFYKNINNIINRQNINFAWVEYLGHQIINKIEVNIGGKVIDFTDAVRMNIHFQLTNKIFNDPTYFKLIGNVPELTTFNNSPKPPYILYIPIDFWFTKFSGLAIPTIYLRHHDVTINVQLNDLINCCYYEELNSTAIIEELIKLDSVKLIANYIYLSDDERKKFAQMGHEYLIDQTQIVNFSNLKSNTLNIDLPFFNPIKQLFWVVRNNLNISRLKYFDYSGSYYVDIYEFLNANNDIPVNTNSPTSRALVKIRTVDINVSSYLNVGDNIMIINSIYYSGTYKVINITNEYVYVQFDYFLSENYKYNYVISSNSGQTTYIQSSQYLGNIQAFICKVINVNPISQSTLILNGVERFDKIDDVYTNFVQSYQYNTRSPNYGLNTFSFALTPEEYQPSGFCNLNPINLTTMNFTFNKTNVINSTYELLIYAHGYNILKFAYGKAAIVLNI